MKVLVIGVAPNERGRISARVRVPADSTLDIADRADAAVKPGYDRVVIQARATKHKWQARAFSLYPRRAVTINRTGPSGLASLLTNLFSETAPNGV